VPPEYLIEKVSNTVTKILLGYRHLARPNPAAQRRP
jgi:hypothetical protein